MCM
ncbi:hypothetical protein LINPERHAP1_LOCUS10154 [Linum perenne]